MLRASDSKNFDVFGGRTTGDLASIQPVRDLPSRAGFAHHVAHQTVSYGIGATDVVDAVDAFTWTDVTAWTASTVVTGLSIACRAQGGSRESDWGSAHSGAPRPSEVIWCCEYVTFRPIEHGSSREFGAQTDIRCSVAHSSRERLHVPCLFAPTDASVPFRLGAEGLMVVGDAVFDAVLLDERGGFSPLLELRSRPRVARRARGGMTEVRRRRRR